MPKKVAIVTGAYGGLGSELCKLLGANDVSVVLVDRNKEKSEAFAATLNAQRPAAVARTYAVDLANHASIRAFVADVIATFPEIHYLFNNAGVLTESLQFSGHENELHFEVNTLAPLALIDGLRPALKNAGGAVVVNTSAGLALGAKELDWDTLVRPRAFAKLFGPYVQSKQAMNVITAALASELAAENIIIRAVDPGPNQTRLTKGAGTPLWMRLFSALLPTPDKGAKKIFDAALSAKWREQTGIFITGGKVAALPPNLVDKQFASDFLRKCRERAALS